MLNSTQNETTMKTESHKHAENSKQTESIKRAESHEHTERHKHAESYKHAESHKCAENTECGEVSGLNIKMTPRAITCANVNLRRVGGNREKIGWRRHPGDNFYCACEGRKRKKIGVMSKRNNHTHCNSMSYAI